MSYVFLAPWRFGGKKKKVPPNKTHDLKLRKQLANSKKMLYQNCATISLPY
jgi:hypothetical protein